MPTDKLNDELDYEVLFYDGESPEASKFNNWEAILAEKIADLQNAVGDVGDESMSSITGSSGPRNRLLNLARAIGDYADLSPTLPDTYDTSTPVSTYVKVPANVREFSLPYPASPQDVGGSYSCLVSSGDSAFVTEIDPFTSAIPDSPGEFKFIIDDSPRGYGDGATANREDSFARKVITYSVTEGEEITYYYDMIDSNGKPICDYFILDTTHPTIPTLGQVASGTALTPSAVTSLGAGGVTYRRITFSSGVLPYEYNHEGESIYTTLRGSTEAHYKLPAFYGQLTGVNHGTVTTPGDILPTGLIKLFNVTTSTYVDGPVFCLGIDALTDIWVTESAIQGHTADEYMLIVGGAATLANSIKQLQYFRENHDHGKGGGIPIDHSKTVGLLPGTGTGATRSGPSTIQGNDHPQYLNRVGFQDANADRGNHDNAMFGDIHMPSTTQSPLAPLVPNYNYNSGTTHKFTFGDRTSNNVKFYGHTENSEWRLQFHGDIDGYGKGAGNETGLYNFAGANFLPTYIVTNRGHARDIVATRTFNTLADAVSAANSTTYGATILIEEGLHPVTSEITVSQGGTSIVGLGKNAWITSSSNIDSLLNITADFCVIDSLRLKTGALGDIDYAISASGADLQVSNCYFQDDGIGGDLKGGILLEDGINRVSIVDNTFRNSGSGGEYCIRMNDNTATVDNIVIARNKLRPLSAGSTAQGIAITCKNDSDSCLISDNIIEYAASVGISVNGPQKTNIVNNITTPESGAGRIAIDNCESAVVAKNNITLSGTAWSTGIAAGSGVTSVKIVTNTITAEGDGDGSSYLLSVDDAITSVLVADNTLVGNSGAGQDGIYGAGGRYDNNITTGVEYALTLADGDGINCANNTLEASDGGVLLASGTLANSTITNNHFICSGSYTIQISSGSINESKISENLFETAGGVRIYASSNITSTSINDNIDPDANTAFIKADGNIGAITGTGCTISNNIVDGSGRFIDTSSIYRSVINGNNVDVTLPAIDVSSSISLSTLNSNYIQSQQYVINSTSGILDCVITSNYFYSSNSSQHAIYCTGDLDDSTFSNNRVISAGASAHGVYFDKMMDSTFAGNYVQGGAGGFGLYVAADETVVMDRSVISGNHIYSDSEACIRTGQTGGGSYGSITNSAITGNTFVRNCTGDNSGIIGIDIGKSFTHSSFVGNSVAMEAATSETTSVSYVSVNDIFSFSVLCSNAFYTVLGQGGVDVTLFSAPSTGNISNSVLGNTGNATGTNPANHRFVLPWLGLSWGDSNVPRHVGGGAPDEFIDSVDEMNELSHA